MGTPPGVLRTRRPALAHHSHTITALARPSQDGFSRQHLASKFPQKQRRCSKTATQASSSSQASVVQRAPSVAQQATLQQQDVAVPRSVLIAIDYTSDAEQALQWALDFVVKPGIAGVLQLCWLSFMCGAQSIGFLPVSVVMLQVTRSHWFMSSATPGPAAQMVSMQPGPKSCFFGCFSCLIMP